MLKFLLFTAALASLTPTLGCQPRVVFLKFSAPMLEVDTLWVEGVDPAKGPKPVIGLQTLGYYDVSKTTIIVRITACLGKEMVAYQQGQYDVVHDEAIIQIDRGIKGIDPPMTPPHSCLPGQARREGGAPDSDVGGAAGGDAVGGAGGDMDAGAGGNTVGGTGGSAVGGAGVGGASGADGGAPDSAECGTDTHGPVCEAPSGDGGQVPDAGEISDACTQYCDNMQTTCASVSGLYDSHDSCLRYCMRAGWVADGTSENSFACRNMYLANAPTFNPAPSCQNAGPSGGGVNCGLVCDNFCKAWIGICSPDPTEAAACLAACKAKQAGNEPGCRFELLQRALYDQRYCNYVKFGPDSCFSCN
jgi:hypothetical protein